MDCIPKACKDVSENTLFLPSPAVLTDCFFNNFAFIC